MPASSFNSYLQDARNNFGAVRPAPICNDANKLMGQCHNVHVSTNCYYGYHHLKRSERNHVDNDCEMLEMELPMADDTSPPPTSRKRSADIRDYPQSKRLREATKLGSEASCPKLKRPSVTKFDFISEGTVPSTTNYNPCLLRPTHNNPDISRCLMVHMI